MDPFGLVAKWIPRRPPEAKIVGSSPIKVDFLFCHLLFYLTHVTNKQLTKSRKENKKVQKDPETRTLIRWLTGRAGFDSCLGREPALSRDKASWALGQAPDS